MKKRMKPLIWPIAVSSIFLLGQTAFAETSEPAQTEPSTTISSSDAEKRYLGNRNDFQCTDR